MLPRQSSERDARSHFQEHGARLFLQQRVYCRRELHWLPGMSCPIEGIRSLLRGNPSAGHSGNVRYAWRLQRHLSYDIENGSIMGSIIEE